MSCEEPSYDMRARTYTATSVRSCMFTRGLTRIHNRLPGMYWPPSVTLFRFEISFRPIHTYKPWVFIRENLSASYAPNFAPYSYYYIPISSIFHIKMLHIPNFERNIFPQLSFRALNANKRVIDVYSESGLC